MRPDSRKQGGNELVRRTTLLGMRTKIAMWSISKTQMKRLLTEIWKEKKVVKIEQCQYRLQTG